MSERFEVMRDLALDDVMALKKAQVSYGDSWKRRGGVGAFMMLARKWDRIENQTTKTGYDIFGAVSAFPGKEGVMDDINDLIRYLMLVRAEVLPVAEDGGEPTQGYVDQG
jgi:hypothetical protein